MTNIEVEDPSTSSMGCWVENSSKCSLCSSQSEIDFNKFTQDKNHAYLFNDALLEEVLETGEYNGDHILEVHLDDFVCRKKENNLVVKSVGYKDIHSIVKKTDCPANAARVGFCKPKNFGECAKRCIDEYFQGQYHLVWFVNNQLKWVVKKLVVIGWMTVGLSDIVYMVNPNFVASDVIDRQDTR